jgi:hypothetical protein
MVPFIEKIKNYFMAHPCPPVIFQLSSSYVTGIHIAVKERKIKHHAFLPLPPGLIEPHFDRKNLTDAPSLARLMKEGLKRLHLSGERVACLIPESCLKIFVLAFESFPLSEWEGEKLIRWRVKKLVPVLPEDARLSYEAMASSASVKVLASLARTAVLQEYEDLFASLGLKVGILTAPTPSLLNLVDWEKEKDLIVANIEDDSVSLVAIANSEMTLYRFKPFAIERQGWLQVSQKIENVVKEIENTVHFIEDREKRGIHSLWLRSGLSESQEEIISELATRLPFSINPIEAPHLDEIPSSERAILAPLAGQIP